MNTRKRLALALLAIVTVGAGTWTFLNSEPSVGWETVLENGLTINQRTYSNCKEGMIVFNPADCDERILFQNADPATLVAVGGLGQYLEEAWARDKNHVYSGGKIVADADAETFVPVENKEGLLVCVKDKKYVWFWAEYPHRTLVSDSVVATGGYCKDSDHVWIGADEVSGADAATFEGLSKINYGEYAKDKNHAYYYGFLISGADADTFTLVPNDESFDAQDKHRKYLRGEAVL